MNVRSLILGALLVGVAGCNSPLTTVQSANIVLKDPKFWKILPQNKALWEALPFVKDVWNTPGYDELLTAAQELLNSAVTGNLPVKDALDQLAERNQATFDSYFPK